MLTLCRKQPCHRKGSHQKDSHGISRSVGIARFGRGHLAIVNIFQSGADTGKKVLWTVLVILLPIVGFILWFFLGHAPPRPRSLSRNSAWRVCGVARLARRRGYALLLKRDVCSDLATLRPRTRFLPGPCRSRRAGAHEPQRAWPSPRLPSTRVAIPPYRAPFANHPPGPCLRTRAFRQYAPIQKPQIIGQGDQLSPAKLDGRRRSRAPRACQGSHVGARGLENAVQAIKPLYPR